MNCYVSKGGAFVQLGYKRNFQHHFFSQFLLDLNVLIHKMKVKSAVTKKKTSKEVSPKKHQGSRTQCNFPEILTDQLDVYLDTERRIHKACDQMEAIHSKIKDLQLRLQRAVKNQRHYFAKNYEMQLQVLQGVYNTYHMYCSRKAEVLMQLEEHMHWGVLDTCIAQTTAIQVKCLLAHGSFQSHHILQKEYNLKSCLKCVLCSIIIPKSKQSSRLLAHIRDKIRKCTFDLNSLSYISCSLETVTPISWRVLNTKVSSNCSSQLLLSIYLTKKAEI